MQSGEASGMVLRFLFGAISIVMMLATDATAQSISLTLAHQYPSTQVIGDAYNYWAERVSELSEGEITVQVFPGSTLIGSDESFAAVVNNSVSASNMIGGFQVGDIPQLAAVAMPFLFDDYAHYRRVVDGGLYDLVAGWYEEKNIKLLNFFPKGHDQVFHKSKFLLEPADYQGAQLRGVGGASDAVLQALGANVVRLPTTEVTSALQRGVVDGIVTSCSAHIGRSWYEQTPYASIVSLKNDLEGLGLNLDVWNSLSPKQQEIVRQAAAEMEDMQWELIEHQEEVECNKDWERLGVKVQKVTPEQREALQEAVASVYDTYGADIPALDEVLKLVEANR